MTASDMTTPTAPIWSIAPFRFEERRLIRLSNLPGTVTHQALYEFLTAVCKVEVQSLHFDPPEVKDPSVRVLFPFGANVAAMRNRIEGAWFNDRHITTTPARPDGLLFLGNLSNKMTPARLVELGKPSGQICRAFVMVDEATMECQGYGFLEFVNKATAIKARADLASRVVDDRPIRVDLMKPVDNDISHFRSRTLFIDRLPKTLTDATRLQTMFESAGQVQFCKLVTVNGVCRGFAFVDMASYHDAVNARRKFNGTVLDGSAIRISFGHPQKTGASIMHGKEEVAKAKARAERKRQGVVAMSPRRGSAVSTHGPGQSIAMPRQSAPSVFGTAPTTLAGLGPMPINPTAVGMESQPQQGQQRQRQPMSVPQQPPHSQAHQTLATMPSQPTLPMHAPQQQHQQSAASRSQAQPLQQFVQGYPQHPAAMMPGFSASPPPYMPSSSNEAYFPATTVPSSQQQRQHLVQQQSQQPKQLRPQPGLNSLSAPSPETTTAMPHVSPSAMAPAMAGAEYYPYAEGVHTQQQQQPQQASGGPHAGMADLAMQQRQGYPMQQMMRCYEHQQRQYQQPGSAPFYPTSSAPADASAYAAPSSASSSCSSSSSCSPLETAPPYYPVSVSLPGSEAVPPSSTTLSEARVGLAAAHALATLPPLQSAVSESDGSRGVQSSAGRMTANQARSSHVSVGDKENAAVSQRFAPQQAVAGTKGCSDPQQSLSTTEVCSEMDDEFFPCLDLSLMTPGRMHRLFVAEYDSRVRTEAPPPKMRESLGGVVVSPTKRGRPSCADDISPIGPPKRSICRSGRVAVN